MKEDKVKKELLSKLGTMRQRISELEQAEVEYKQTKKALRESEEEFRLLVNSIEDYAIFMMDPQGYIVSWNIGAERITGYKAEEIIGQHFSCFYTSEDIQQSKPEELLKKAALEGRIKEEGWRIRKDGSRFWASAIITVLQDEDRNIRGFAKITQDITKRKKAEEELCKVYRALKVLGEGNHILVHATKESDLLDKICQIIVETGGYRLAWVGFAEQDEGKTVRPVAQAGYEDGYLKIVNITWADAERGRGPVGTAIRTGKPYIAKNILTDPNFAPWRNEAARRGYASVIGLPLIANGHIFGTLAIYAAEPDAFDSEEVKLLMELANDLAYGIMMLRTRTEHKRAEEELKQSFKKLRKTMEGTIQVMALTVEMKDPYTAGHQRRVAKLACTIAKKMGLSKDQIEGIHMAGIIHDLGKIFVPAEILSKPGPITKTEFDIIKIHPQVGYDILKKIEFPWPVAQIVLQHHERMDGSGYPVGLLGKDILLEARILAVADVVEAMASHRPYRPALGLDKALDEISQNKGVLYDTDVVETCLKIFKEEKYNMSNNLSPS